MFTVIAWLQLQPFGVWLSWFIDGYVELSQPLDALDTLSEEEVRKAIWKPRQDKAPGVNGHPNRLLRAVYEGLKEQFRHLFQACYDLGYHPRPFKEANTIILKKL